MVPTPDAPTATAAPVPNTPTTPPAPAPPATGTDAAPPAVTPTGAAAPATTVPSPGPGIYQLGQQAVITPGVVLVITQMAIANEDYTWQGTVRNDTDQPFAFQLAQVAAHFQDNTGQLDSSPQVEPGSRWPTSAIAPHTRAPVVFIHRFANLAGHSAGRRPGPR